MDKPVVLISAAYGDIGSSAVRSFREAAKKIIGCDMRPHTSVSMLLDKFYQAPAATDKTRYLDFIGEVIKREKVDFFLPISEAEIEILNKERPRIEALGTRLLLNNQNIIDTFLDKIKAVKYLEGLDIKVPRTMLLSSYDGSYGYPVVVKSRKGHGSKKLWKVMDSRDLEYVRGKDDGSLLIQEHIGSEEDEYTTGIFSDGDNVSSITFRRELGFGSMSIEAILSDQPYIDNMAKRIAKDTGLVGSINMQCRRVGDDFIPFEINPRLSSTLLFRKRFGFDDAVWWLDILRGNRYSYKPVFKSGKAVRSLSECYFNMEKL